MTRGMRAGVIGVLVLLAVSLRASPAPAQIAQATQAQAAAARTAVLVAVERGVAALPPSSGQAIVWELDASLDSYRESPTLGPTALRSPLTIGKNRLALRVASSYFDAADDFGTVAYGVRVGREQQDSEALALGLSASAAVWLTSFSGTIGLSDTTQLTFSLPLLNVHANAQTRYTTLAGCTGDDCLFVYATAIRSLSGETPRSAVERAIDEGSLQLESRSLRPQDGFGGGDGVHLGRTGLELRRTLCSGDLFQLAVELGALLPSPDEEDFAGSNSLAVIPRVIAGWSLSPELTLRTDVGYENDFDVQELRRFAWNAGITYGVARFSIDLGFGGSEYTDPLQWTPERFSYTANSDPKEATTDPDATRIGTTYADFLFGVKVALTDQLFISGVASVPVTSGGFAPAALGTWAIEYYF